MKLVGKHIESDKSGHFKLLPEDEEDIWHLYNLILPTDEVEASTYRRISKETSNANKSESDRIRLNLMIQVETVHIDLTVGLLHLNGKVSKENKYVKMASYHTLDIEMGKPVKIFKSHWDSVSFARVHEALNTDVKAEIAAIIFELGIAHICLITDYTNILKQKIEVQIPKKHNVSANPREKAIHKFYSLIYKALKQNILIDKVKVIILASPGFFKEDLYEFIMNEANTSQDTMILENKKKFLTTHASNGYMNALPGIFTNPGVKAKLAGMKCSDEEKTLQEFLTLLRLNPEKAYYGYHHVLEANKLKAIHTLLISASLFRSIDLEVRKKYIKLVDSVKYHGGTVQIFSSLSNATERLDQLSGVAAILNYPIPEIDIIEANE